MPSPCEVVPESAEFVLVQSPTPTASRGMPGKLIPAIAGGTFAGLLLIVLGCTPLFKPAAAQAEAQQATIVRAAPSSAAVKTQKGSADSKAKSPTSDPNATVIASSTSGSASASASTSAGGVTTIASASSKRGGVSATEGDNPHRFTIDCNPLHANEESSAARPENVALQGIMAGQTSRAALLDGVLYREGDRFGSRVCPWTIAMIDVASVRIEKAFGDRTCGVTIRFQQEKNGSTRQQASAMR